MVISALDIVNFREKKGWTQEELAEKIFVSSRTIQNYEAGGTIPKSKHAILHSLFNETSGVNESQSNYPNDIYLEKEGVKISEDEILIWLYRNLERLKNQEKGIYDLVFRDMVNQEAKDMANKILEELKNQS